MRSSQPSRYGPDIMPRAYERALNAGKFVDDEDQRRFNRAMASFLAEMAEYYVGDMYLEQSLSYLRDMWMRLMDEVGA